MWGGGRVGGCSGINYIGPEIRVQGLFFWEVTLSYFLGSTRLRYSTVLDIEKVQLVLLYPNRGLAYFSPYMSVYTCNTNSGIEKVMGNPAASVCGLPPPKRSHTPLPHSHFAQNDCISFEAKKGADKTFLLQQYILVN